MTAHRYAESKTHSQRELDLPRVARSGNRAERGIIYKAVRDKELRSVRQVKNLCPELEHLPVLPIREVLE